MAENKKYFDEFCTTHRESIKLSNSELEKLKLSAASAKYDVDEI
jgi:hypothetical protein